MPWVIFTKMFLVFVPISFLKYSLSKGYFPWLSSDDKNIDEKSPKEGYFIYLFYFI